MTFFGKSVWSAHKSNPGFNGVWFESVFSARLSANNLLTSCSGEVVLEKENENHNITIASATIATQSEGFSASILAPQAAGTHTSGIAIVSY